jgi:Zn-dependent protease
MFNITLVDIIALIPAFIIGFTVHEFSHAWVADRLGDPTPRYQGRLTLNPMAHLDPLGTIMLIIGGFGWGKPVEINPVKFTRKVSMRTGDLLVSIAGPLSNLILAFIFSFVLVAFNSSSYYSADVYPIFYNLVWINLVLFAFNLLPVPPLDGFHVLRDILPRKYDRTMDQIEQYGYVLLLFIVFTGVTGIFISPIIGILYEIFTGIANLVVGAFL